MSTRRRYAFRPAAARGAQSYELGATHLEETGGWSLPLADVTAAAFATVEMKGTRFMRLDLWAGEKRRSLSYSAAARGWTGHPDARAFLELARDTLRELGKINPDLEVTLGTRGGPRLAMFAIGLVSVLAGGGVFIGAVASGVSGDRLVAAAAPMVLPVLLGAALAYGYSPWRKPPVGRPGAVADILDGMISKLPASAGRDA